MKNVTRILSIPVFLMATLTWANTLDQQSAGVYLSVEKFAKISNLDDIYMKPENALDPNSRYDGSDQFRLEANTAVLVSVEGKNLSNGRQEIKTEYRLDGKESKFETDKGIHDSEHSVDAQAWLAGITGQEAGDYKSEITVTVSAL